MNTVAVKNGQFRDSLQNHWPKETETSSWYETVNYSKRTEFYIFSISV